MTKANIRKVYDECQGAWTGCDWTALHGRWEIDIDGGDPAKLREAAEIIGSGAANEDVWDWPIVRQIPPRETDQDSDEFMTLRQYLAAVAADLDSAADWLDECVSEADSAEAKAEEAMEAVDAGNLSLALGCAKLACAHESTYGDSPTWTPFRRAIEEAIEATERGEMCRACGGDPMLCECVTPRVEGELPQLLRVTLK